jgi:hypothetical protein
MKSRLLYFLGWLIVSGSSLFSYQYELAVCAIFQDEAPYLKEWIEFHRMMGVQRFWLYNNNSTDNYQEVLEPYIKKRIVKLIDWPSPLDADWTPYQNAAYADCMTRSLGKAKWVAVIDIDEFIVPVDHEKQILSTLRKIEKTKPRVGGLMLFWQFFGTSHLHDIPPGKTFVETMLLKAPKDYTGNRHVKTICRPEYVENCYVHVCTYKPGFRDMALNGNCGPYQPIQTEPIRIHHYFTRTERYLYEKKIPRRQRYEGKAFDCESIARLVSQWDEELNQEFDNTILKYVPKLRKRLGY